MTTLFGRLRQPEYTGENRCLPCTVVNLLIAVLLAAGTLLAAIAAGAGTQVGAGLAVAVLVLSIGAIYVRGYLVPGTPELTKRYLPRSVLRWFGKAPPAKHGVGQSATAEPTQHTEDTITEVEPERLLTEAGALEPCANADDLCLTEPFGADWRSAVRETRESGSDRERLLTVLGAEEMDLEFVEGDEAFWARSEGRRVGTWESRAAFFADVAAAPLLANRLDDWDRLSVQARGRLLNGLRLFLEHCPSCDADLEFDTETVESCCSSYEVAALSCESCGARLFESDPL